MLPSPLTSSCNTTSRLTPTSSGQLTPTSSPVYFCEIRYVKLMRSPERKGTVPSLPMSTPSKLQAQ